MADKPHFVFRDGITADRDYVQWLSEVKQRFRQCQIIAIRYMRRWFAFYCEDVAIRHQADDELKMPEIFGGIQ